MVDRVRGVLLETFADPRAADEAALLITAVSACCHPAVPVELRRFRRSSRRSLPNRIAVQAVRLAPKIL